MLDVLVVKTEINSTENFHQKMEIVKFTKSKPFNRKFLKFWKKVKWNRLYVPYMGYLGILVRNRI